MTKHKRPKGLIRATGAARGGGIGRVSMAPKDHSVR